MRSYLIGTGWWPVWYLCLWLWLVPAGFAAWWLGWVFVPGGGPQGGEAMFLVILLTLLGLGAVTVVDAVLLGVGLDGPWWLRFAALPLAAVAFVVAVAGLFFTAIDAAGDDGPAGAVIMMLVVLGLVWVNLWALDRFRTR